MGLFRRTRGLFRGRPEQIAKEPAAELVQEQAGTVSAQPVVARREVKREARPDPDKPGWGRAIV